MKIIWRAAAALTAAVLIVQLCGCGKKGAQSAQTSAEGSFGVYSLDVGKGDCFILAQGTHYAMLDAGYDDTSDLVMQVLDYLHIDSLDFLCITHYDKDHVGGAAEVIRRVGIGTVYLPDYVNEENTFYAEMRSALDETGINTVSVQTDTPYTLGGASGTIYASPVTYDPAKNGEGNDNDLSLIVDTFFGADSYLFSGDIEKAGIKAWLGKHNTAYDVLKVPHHGRKEEKEKSFLRTVKPKYALITDSADEPADEKVLELLEEQNAAVYRSSLNGTYRIMSDGSGNYTVETER